MPLNKIYKWQAHENILNVTSHQENTNLNHSEMSVYIHKNDYNF